MIEQGRLRFYFAATGTYPNVRSFIIDILSRAGSSNQGAATASASFELILKVDILIAILNEKLQW